MRRGKIDAVLTSYQTIESAGLEDKGIRYAFEDRQYFPQYVPLCAWFFLAKALPGNTGRYPPDLGSAGQ